MSLLKYLMMLMILKYGEITQPVLRHTCDNSWCINPDHLIQGTQLDNIQDMESRGRHSKPYNAVLNPELVVEIYNNNNWIERDIHNIDIEYDRMYKLLMKYEKVRIKIN